MPTIIALMRMEREPQSKETEGSTLRTARDWTRHEVLRDPILYLLPIGTLALAFIVTVIFFHQSYLIELRGYDPLAFATSFAVMSVTTIVSGFVCGYLVDRFGALKLLPVFLLPLAIASLAVGLITAIWGLCVFMLLVGVSNGFTSTLLGSP
jgi:sugar phosphate permease